MERMGQQQSQTRSSSSATHTSTMQQQPQPQAEVAAKEAMIDQKQGNITSLAAHHAAAKLTALQQQQQQQGGEKLSSSTKASRETSRSNSFSAAAGGDFEKETQIKETQQPAAAVFPSRPVSSRGHMLPQSAQMISEKERQREAEMEHIFTPQPGQIIAERCQYSEQGAAAV